MLKARPFTNSVCKSTYESLPGIYCSQSKRIKAVKVSKKSSSNKTQPNSTKVHSKTSWHRGMFRSKDHSEGHPRSFSCNSQSDTNQPEQKIVGKKLIAAMSQIQGLKFDDQQSQQQLFIIQKARSGPRAVGGFLRRGNKHQATDRLGRVFRRTSKPASHSKSSAEQAKTETKSGIIKGLENIEVQSPHLITRITYPDPPGSSDSALCPPQITQSLSNAPRANPKRAQKTAEVFGDRLFVIPEQPEYGDYLRNYQPQDPKLVMAELVRKPNFRAIRSSEDLYFGEVNKEMEKHGMGISISEQQIYEGRYQNNAKTQGFEKNIDGVYRGGFLNGIRQGFGTFLWNNGESYQGDWHQGKRSGKGTWKSAHGHSYEGQWKNNRRDGKGVFKHEGSTYVGDFHNFHKSGHGQELFANGDQYIGEYQEGKPYGKGCYEWKQGGFYEGYFIEGIRENFDDLLASQQSGDKLTIFELLALQKKS